ncbi:MAG: hypothetical protein V9E83_10970 [Baekduia sp.]
MERLTVLFYDYVPDIVERRGPHREQHLALLNEHGSVLAGALGDPPHGAAIVFESAEQAEAFRAADPYGAAGLVQGSRIEPWTIAVRKEAGGTPAV